MNIFKLISQVTIDPGDVPMVSADESAIEAVLQIVFGVLGGISLLVIVIAGLRYTTSRGNPDATGKAKNAIIYAAVGLVVSALAFSIVSFVVGAAS